MAYQEFDCLIFPSTYQALAAPDIANTQAVNIMLFLFNILFPSNKLWPQNNTSFILRSGFIIVIPLTHSSLTNPEQYS